MPSQHFKGFKVFKGLERFKGLEGFRAGKRQTWTPIKKPLMCGLGVPVGCQSGHKKPLMCGLAVPIRSHSCVASGWP